MQIAFLICTRKEKLEGIKMSKCSEKKRINRETGEPDARMKFYTILCLLNTNTKRIVFCLICLAYT